MSYYEVSHRGHLVAIVKTIELAQKIVRCRRRGYYAIQKVESDAGSRSRIKQLHTPSAPKRQVKRTPKPASSRATKTARKSPSPNPGKSR